MSKLPLKALHQQICEMQDKLMSIDLERLAFINPELAKTTEEILDKINGAERAARYFIEDKEDG